MASQQNTLSILTASDHIRDAIAGFVQDALPQVNISNTADCDFVIQCQNNEILLNIKDRAVEKITTPIKIAHLIQIIQKSYAKAYPIIIGPYIFDYAARILTEGDDILHLTEKEAEVLSYLNQNRGVGITRDDLLKDVWGYADGIDTHTIETHIYRLRQKIEKNPDEADIILTLDDGYQLVENV